MVAALDSFASNLRAPHVSPAGSPRRLKVAVVGTGIAGNVAAYRLAREHDITVFEADSRIGGHTNTLDIEYDGRQYAVDTGFIVFNDRTYPNFIALLDELGVGWRDSDMSFSVQHETIGLEYNGTTYNSLFAQRSNLLRPSFYRMIRDIVRFNREAPALLEPGASALSLDEYLADGRYSREFIEHYIIPMGAAIWSTQPQLMGEMPARFFVRFFENHGLLNVYDRPTWRVVEGGSSRYVDKLVAGHRDRIRLNTPVEAVRRVPGGVEIKARGLETERFDHVFFACHSDDALEMLTDATPAEREVLGAIPYEHNDVVLHTDASLMPKRRLAWAAWNYHILRRAQARVAVTYNMNILQGIEAPVEFCVTLNNTAAIDPSKIIARFDYRHPMFTPDAVAAQQRHAEISGADRTYYCGAYWRYGFHEDGVVSALTALEQFNDRIRHEQRYLRRAS
ncbi:MAG: NAD(P)-binding protein [Gammaproteobacteria bacterium]|nr:NAD(P)-binding protein [Gammaproteobacteria bacterium]